jgi:hypothetical protein
LTDFHGNEAKKIFFLKQKIKMANSKKLRFSKPSILEIFQGNFMDWSAILIFFCKVKVSSLAMLDQNFDLAKRDNTFLPRPNIMHPSVAHPMLIKL